MRHLIVGQKVTILSPYYHGHWGWIVLADEDQDCFYVRVESMGNTMHQFHAVDLEPLRQRRCA
jgi:hypothetical protein